MVKSQVWAVKGGLQRDDSDDELGNDDIPWEWIYDKVQIDEDATPTRKRKASAMLAEPVKSIIGARFGKFLVKVGDAVLLKSPEQGRDWAGIICAFSETDEDESEEMCAYIQWFCLPEELVTASGKRPTSMPVTIPNETFITADFNMNPLTAINGKATVLSTDAFYARYPNGVAPRDRTAASQFAKTIVCRRAVKQRNMIFSDEFAWDDLCSGPQDLLDLLDWIREHTKRRSKTRPEDTIYQPVAVADETAPVTPRKRKASGSATPTPKSSRSKTMMTPTNKRILVKKALEITPLGTRIMSPSHLPSGPHAMARSTLHVSAVPASLPCRQHEFDTVYSTLHSAITDGGGTCIYISGTPGTGKTATVREVVAALHDAVLRDELDGFNFVEINGMKVTDPHQSYALLWEALKGDRVSATHALELLEHDFSHPNPRRIPCVVLMDELDQLVTKTQSVMYNFFNWPALRHSRLIVLAVANTMDLPERTLSNKISSRLGLTRITFPGYTHAQLMEIISSRLEGVPGNIVDSDAIQFAARKVAAVSGDARRALDICRRAVEIAEQRVVKITADLALGDDADSSEYDDPSPTSPSKSGRGDCRSRAEAEGRVTIDTIRAAINEATSSPIAQCLRALSVASKLFLAALLAMIRRTGVSEQRLGEVFAEAKRMANVSDDNIVRDFILADVRIPRMLAVEAAAMDLVELGLILIDTRSRGERAGKVRLRISEEDVKGALSGDLAAKGMGFED